MTRSEIQKLHKEAVVCLSYVNPWIEYGPKEISARKYFTESATWMEASIPMMRKGGVDIVVLSHGHPEAGLFKGAEGTKCLLRCYDAIINEIEKNRDLVLIFNVRDLDRAIREKKMGILLHITGAPFDNDLALLRTYFRVGIRAVHPFANDSSIGGHTGGPKSLGLQPFGRKLIREMERLGMLVDVTHTNDRTFSEAVRFAKRPVINSHTNCRAFIREERCCTDAQLRMLAKRRGVLGAHFGFLEDMTPVVDADHRKMMKAFEKKLNAMKRKYKDPYEFLQHRMNPWEWPISLGGAVEDGTHIHRPTIQQLGEHIEHMVKVAGIDHVCIGSDYSSGAMPQGVETAETLVNLTAEMARRGLTANQIKKIWGGNFLRILRQTLPA